MEPGQRIGGYRLVRNLGVSGLGTVFEATCEAVGQRVAIKILHPHFAPEPQSAEQFAGAMQAVSELYHPGFVKIYDLRWLADGTTFIVMEYLEGELLSVRLAKHGPLSLMAALRLLHQIASALSAAHERGLVHAALSPDGLMFIPDPRVPGGERVKILDFGITRLRTASSTGGDALTGVGTLRGSPNNQAPEQYCDEPGVSVQADVYALGTILYESLAGRPPFAASSIAQLLSMQLNDHPTPLRQLDPSIPADVADLVQRMLTKEPTDRPKIQEVNLALETYSPFLGDRVITLSAPASAPVSMRKLGEPIVGSTRSAPGSPRSSDKGSPNPDSSPGSGRSVPSLPSACGALELDEALARLDQGCFGVDAPRRMVVDVAVKVTAAAVRDRRYRELIMQNAEHDAPRLADTPLGQFVRVELIPDSPVEFTVVPLSDTEQPVLRAELTQWEWLVTPRQVGLRKRLRVRATNIVDVGGQRLTKSHPARTLEVDVTVEAAAIPGSGEVSTAMVRKLLDEALPSDATLESFCLDYLPQVYLRFGGGMERMQKVTLLLSVASPRQVLERLCEAEPDKVEELLAKLPPATVQPPTPSATLLSVPLPTQMPAAAPPIAPAPVPLASAREAARHDVQALPAQQLDPRPPSAQPGAATQQAADTDVAQRWRRLVILLLGLLLTLAAIGIYRCAVHVP